LSYDAREEIPSLNALGTFAKALFFAAACTVVFGWLLFKAINSAAKSATNPKAVRRNLILLSAFYAINTLIIATEVVQGSQPPLALAGLPVVILFMWVLWRSLNRTKITPQQHDSSTNRVPPK
jgi:hypothetical protein